MSILNQMALESNFNESTNIVVKILGKGSENKIRISYGLLPNRGAGGSARLVKKPYCFFEKSIFSESM